jgi:hypothetical protein
VLADVPVLVEHVFANLRRFSEYGFERLRDRRAADVALRARHVTLQIGGEYDAGHT